MTIFVELDFLINLVLDPPKSYSEGYYRLFNLFDTYTEFDLFIDREPKDSDEFDLVRRFITEYEPVKGYFTKEDLQKADFVPPSQTLIFTCEELSNAKDLSAKGALTFSGSNYVNKIEQIVRSIHFDLDFSSEENRPKDWNFMNSYSAIPTCNITITDNYLFSGSKDELKKNLHQLLQEITVNPDIHYNITIFTTYKRDPNNRSSLSDERIKDAIKENHRKLNSILTGRNKSILIGNSELRGVNDYDFHDRYLYTSFSILYSGRGVNLFPVRMHSLMTLSSSSIFDKSTYNKLKSHNRIIEKFKDKLFRHESHEFVKYPDDLRTPPLSSTV